MFVITLPICSGVYCIKNLTNNKRLICFSKNMKHNAQLCFQHLYKNDYDTNKTMQDDWNLNPSWFTVELLELTDDKNRIFYYIRKYDSINNGYNTKYKSDCYLYNHLPNSSGVYQILNKNNNKLYIGFSSDIKRRVRDHFGELRRNNHWVKSFQQDWNRGDDFYSMVIELTEDANKEEYYIRLFNSWKNGYNILIGNIEKENGELLRQ